ncbi:MAG: hypothetical protein C5B52_05800 [Bacteroidetes bacterium]|nr:MAG: hypothetical protein C5B52_05800 [Bacteroidota bacterium]
MTSRRDFIKQSSLLTATVMIRPDWIPAVPKKVGVQLYTVRNEISKDPKGVLAKIAGLGFKEVETFGYNGTYWGLTGVELADTLKSLGLTSPSGHYYAAGSFYQANWMDKFKLAIEDVVNVGQKYYVVPWMEENYRGSIDTYKKLAADFNKAAEYAKKAGVQFAYHNHDFEFKEFEGKTGYHVLVGETDPKLVKFEMDLYWVSFAGKDPIELFKNHPGRFPLWHLKDMDNTDKKFFTEVGNGVIDFKKIFTYAKKAGLQHFYVEQDQCPGPPLASLEKSIGYIKKNLVN